MRKIYTLILFLTIVIFEGKSQNVGVGTSSPASKLEIRGGGTTSASSALNVTNSGATSLVFIRDDGNVGVGISSPATKLDVNGSLRVGVSSASGMLFSQFSSALTDVPGSTSGMQITGPVNAHVVLDIQGNDANDGFYVRVPTTLVTSPTVDKTAFVVKASGNVGVGTNAPGQKLHLNGNFKMDGVSVEGSTNYRVYRNLGSYSSGSGATGAFVIVTAQPWNSTCMFRAEIEGYFYDATAPFEITVAGYIYNNNAFYNYGYINTGSKSLIVRLGRNIATNTVAIILGDEAGSYSYPKISISSYMQGHAGINESYAAGWTITQQTNLTGITDYMVTVPDVTKLNGFGSGDFIQNQSTADQTASFRISGNGLIAGNVGIGTISPDEKLHVSGNVRLGGAYALNSEGDHLSMMYGVRADDSAYEWIGFYSNTTRQGIILYDGSWSGANSLTNEFSLTAENNNLLTLNTTNNHVAIMPKGGNVGINTLSPQSTLHVNGRVETSRLGTVGTYNSAEVQGIWSIGRSYNIDATANDFGNQYGITYAHTNAGTSTSKLPISGWGHQILFTSDGTRNAAISLSSGHGYFAGNVGIGNTAPAEKLDVSGNVRATGIVYWGDSETRTESRADAGLQGNAGAKSGFYQTSAPAPAANWPIGASSWWHLLDVRHSNAANNYAMQIAGSFFDQDLYYRKTNGSASTAWSKILTSTSSIDQSFSSYTSSTELALTSNNTGSFSYSAGAGWTPGTWQNVSSMSVSKTITSGNMVHVTVTARIEGDNYNYFTPSCAYFRLMRGTTELARTAVLLTPASYVPSSFWYFNSNTLSFDYVDSGVSGSQTYSIQYWLPNESSSYSENVFIAERSLNVIELRQ